MLRFLLKYRSLVIVLAVLLPRVAWFVHLDGNLPLPVRDQSVYLRLAGRIVTGSGLSFSREMGLLKHVMGGETRLASTWSGDPEYVFGIVPVETPTASIEPGYPLILALMFLITGPSTGAVFLINCSFMLLGAWALWRLLEENWGSRQALLGTLLWALYPYYIYYSAYAMTEALHISMMPVIILFTLRASRSGRCSLLAGAASGILFLIRSTAIVLVPLQMMYLLMKREWKRTLLVAAGFMACCIPLMVRNLAVMGSPVLMPTKGSLNLWMRNHPEVLEIEGITLPGWVENGIGRRDLLQDPDMDEFSTELERSSVLTGYALRFIAANPVMFAYLSALRLVMFVSPVGGSFRNVLTITMGFLLYLPMLVLSIMELIRRRHDGRVLLLASFFVLYMLLHSIAHGGIRYRLPVELILMVLSVLFVSRRLGWTESTDAGL